VDKVADVGTVLSNSYQPNAQNKNIYTQVHFKRKSKRLRMLWSLPLLKLAESQRYSKAIQGPARRLRFAAPKDSPLS
jgi:hypothetical protein